MINNPKIGQKVWFLEPWGQCIHSAKIIALGETEVSVRNPEKYPYADIEWDDGGNSGCLLKNLYASREELQKELKKEEENKIAEIKAKIKDASDLVAFMYDHCVACAEEYTDWTARRAVKEIAKEMLGLDLDQIWNCKKNRGESALPVALYFSWREVEWKKKKRKNESESVLAGQAGMEVASQREVVWADMKRYAAKGCWPAGAGMDGTATGKYCAL